MLCVLLPPIPAFPVCCLQLSDQADFDKNTHDNNENNNVAAAVVQVSKVG